MENKILTCIGCPIGCELTVTIYNENVIEVKGNSCKNGQIYAKKECTNPTRVITSTVRVKGGQERVVSVKTEFDIPKDKIFQCIQELRDIEINAPIKVGQLIKANIAGTGVNIIATKQVNIY